MTKRLDFISSKQEPKYGCDSKGLFNRHTDQHIPEDEPVFLFRAKDAHALQALVYYSTLCADSSHKMVVTGRINNFRDFSEKHPDRVQEPDSVAAPLPRGDIKAVCVRDLPEIEINSRWRHTNGVFYTVRAFTNLNSERPDQYPPTVIYTGINGLQWSRPISDWHRSMTLIEDKWESKT